jgi:hypothetical protein
MQPEAAGTEHRLKRKRRWYQCSLPTLVVLVPVLAVELTLLGLRLGRVREIQNRERIQEALLRAGGGLNDEYQLEGRLWQWARVRNDAGLEYVESVPQLQILDLTDSRVTDAGMKHLKKLVHLERLFLDGTDVTDAGLEHLKGLAELRILELYATQVTDAGAADLRKALPHCEIRH